MRGDNSLSVSRASSVLWIKASLVSLTGHLLWIDWKVWSFDKKREKAKVTKMAGKRMPTIECARVVPNDIHRPCLVQPPNQFWYLAAWVTREACILELSLRISTQRKKKHNPRKQSRKMHSYYMSSYQCLISFYGIQAYQAQSHCHPRPKIKSSIIPILRT